MVATDCDCRWWLPMAAIAHLDGIEFLSIFTEPKWQIISAWTGR